MSKTDQHGEAKAYLTPPEVARLLGVDHAKVLNWIRSGELGAVDLSADRKQRPRYKIAQTCLDAFLDRRATRPAPKLSPRRRKVNQNAVEYY